MQVAAKQMQFKPTDMWQHQSRSPFLPCSHHAGSIKKKNPNTVKLFSSVSEAGWIKCTEYVSQLFLTSACSSFTKGGLHVLERWKQRESALSKAFTNTGTITLFYFCLNASLPFMTWFIQEKGDVTLKQILLELKQIYYLMITNKNVQQRQKFRWKSGTELKL